MKLANDPLIKESWHSPYSAKTEYVNQCSSCQIYNFKHLSSFAEFKQDIETVMEGFRVGVCVSFKTRWFWAIKFLWWFKWRVLRVGFTGGNGTMWIIKKRIWVS